MANLVALDNCESVREYLELKFLDPRVPESVRETLFSKVLTTAIAMDLDLQDETVTGLYRELAELIGNAYLQGLVDGGPQMKIIDVPESAVEPIYS